MTTASTCQLPTPTNLISTVVEIDKILRRLPQFEKASTNRLPLLTALRQLDARTGSDHARRLMVASSLVHVGADERWVAEYLLRHRRELPNGRPAASLVIAARCAAEMDLRKARRREVPVEPAVLVALSAGESRHQLDSPSVGEVVIDFLEAATMLRLSDRAGELVRDAVAVVVEMAERHVLNGGTGPSLIAMRPAARPEARLVTRLRALVPMASARRLAKLLVGADGTPLETGALWWAARSAESAEHVPLLIRGKWTRDLLVVEAEARTAPIAASRAA